MKFFINLLIITFFSALVQGQTINHWETAVFNNDVEIARAGITGISYNYRPVPAWFMTPFDFTSSNLPIVVITTKPGETIKNEPKITAEMKIIHNGGGIRNNVSDSGNIYNGKIGIEIRGMYSASLPQKPYGFETRDIAGNNLDVSLLGMPSENDWVLLANYNDKTFLRNVLAFELFEKMGHYAPRTRYCEVVLNDEYQGIYLLGEKIKTVMTACCILVRSGIWIGHGGIFWKIVCI